MSSGELSAPDAAPPDGAFVYKGQKLSREERNSIVHAVVDSSVKEIPKEAFDGCESLVSIRIPESVTTIGYAAFGACWKLVSIHIPESVTTIGDEAFDGCSSLKSIRIPESVTTIGYQAFRGCSSLASIRIPESVTTIGGYVFGGCKSLKSIRIPESVTTIGYGAFGGCKSLASIHIPESVTTIGEGAFHGCTSLVSIRIPESVTTIGNRAFGGCKSLHWSNIPERFPMLRDYLKQEVYSMQADAASFRLGGVSDQTKNTNDQLNYETYASALVNIVDKIEQSGGGNFAVGLMASWGVGKTKLWHLVKDKIEKADNNCLNEDVLIPTRILTEMPEVFVDLVEYLYNKYRSYFGEEIDCDEMEIDCERMAATLAPTLPFLLPFLFVSSLIRVVRRTPRDYGVLDSLRWIRSDRNQGQHQVYLNKDMKDAQNVWRRLDGYLLNPISILRRKKSLSIPALLRFAVLIFYWIAITALQLLVMCVRFVYGFCFGGCVPHPSTSFVPSVPNTICVKKHIFVDFNAWVFNGSDVLWASFMLQIIGAVASNYPSYSYQLFKLKSKIANDSISPDCNAAERKKQRDTIFMKYCVRTFVSIMLSLVLFVVGTVGLSMVLGKDESENKESESNKLESNESESNEWYDNEAIQLTATVISILGGVVGLSSSISKFLFAFLPAFCDDPTKQLLKAAASATGAQGHDFSVNAGFMRKVKEEIDSISDFLQTEPIVHMKNYYRKPHLSIFVDDLDRCHPKTIVQVLQAITLLLQNEMASTAWLAIDPQIVVSAIDEDYGDFMRNAGVDGVDFLDKVIQLPFCIPRMTKQKKDTLMARMLIPNVASPDSEPEKALEHSKKALKLFTELKDRVDVFDNNLMSDEFSDLKDFRDNWKDEYYSDSKLSNLRILLGINEEDGVKDEEVLRKAYERIHYLQSLESQIQKAVESAKPKARAVKIHDIVEGEKGTVSNKESEEADEKVSAHNVSIKKSEEKDENETIHNVFEESEEKVEEGTAQIASNREYEEKVESSTLRNMSNKKYEEKDESSTLRVSNEESEEKEWKSTVSDGENPAAVNEESEEKDGKGTVSDEETPAAVVNLRPVEAVFNLGAEEWFWIKSFSNCFPEKARKIKRIINVYNVSREITRRILPSPKTDKESDRVFRRKLIKAIVLVEMWPQRMAWIFQVAKGALAVEKTGTLCETWECGTKLNKLMRRIYEKIKKPEDRANPSMKYIFQKIPIAMLYCAIVEPLMHSVCAKRDLFRQDVNNEDFEYLLKEEDNILHDKLYLSDIYPEDYKDGFDRKKPSLRTFLFNMQDYYCDEASFAMSQIIICDAKEPEAAETATNLNIEVEKKSDRYTRGRGN